MCDALEHHGHSALDIARINGLAQVNNESTEKNNVHLCIDIEVIDANEFAAYLTVTVRQLRLRWRLRHRNSALSSTFDSTSSSTSQNDSQAVQAPLYTAMRLSLTLTWAALAHLAWSSSDEALICISEKAQRTTDQPPVISPKIARLVLGQRLDLSQYQNLGDIDEKVLDILNDLPGKRPRLFSNEQPNPFPRVLTVVEDVKDTEGTLLSSPSSENIYLYV